MDPDKDADGLHPMNLVAWSSTSPPRCPAPRTVSSPSCAATAWRSRAPRSWSSAAGSPSAPMPLLLTRRKRERDGHAVPHGHARPVVPPQARRHHRRRRRFRPPDPVRGDEAGDLGATPGWTSPTILPSAPRETPSRGRRRPASRPRPDQVGGTGGGDDDVGALEVGRQVARARVALRGPSRSRCAG